MPHLVLSMKTNRPLTVISLLLSLSMAAMEMTVVSTAMPTVVGDLGGIHLYSWVFTAYLLTSTVTVPLYGKLADLYGRKPVLLAGIAIFLAGSMASGLARSIGALIAFRALQGLGGGASGGGAGGARRSLSPARDGSLYAGGRARRRGNDRHGHLCAALRAGRSGRHTHRSRQRHHADGHRLAHRQRRRRQDVAARRF